ncbi:uncharacterized protein LOC123526332 isoform X2 [Mercenaria mercenaria]|uniref:uncharacterized protein LOC123526332 isoform X2 n=1 Tax=Mercenaria mercenaria TaxID=6596 RepID=UPI00234E3F8F|nr:uncharacterized protein LOC123526332 isoform X2 [Mercenaria mercenaria]
MERALQNEEKLSPLIEGIVKSVQKETKCERANLIRNAIEFHLKTWLDAVENTNTLFKLSELIHAGSYAEGTKIIHPDEFDFLAVIDDLSQPDSVIIDNNASNFQEGLVKVAVADDRLKSRWNTLCKNGHLQCFQSVDYPKNKGEYRFGHVFISTLWEKIRNGNKIGLTDVSLTDIACKVQLQTVNNIPLFLKGAEYSTPNIFIEFELENREISVDLSLAIRYHNIEDCFKAEDCVGPAFAELVLSRKSLLLVATRNNFDVKVTVTEAEVQYMQSVMKQEHKVIYIFMKYITKLYCDHLFRLPSFTSYMLKTVCIHHDIKCKNKNRTVAECLKSVIKELDVCTRQEYVISLVNRHIRLRSKTFVEEKTINRKSMLNGMRKLWQLPDKISTVNEFDAFLRHLIQQERQSRDEEKRLLQQEWGQFNQSTVSKFIDMGFEPEAVHKAMRASYYDPDMAVEYLKNNTLTSIPRTQEYGVRLRIASLSF